MSRGLFILECAFVSAAAAALLFSPGQSETGDLGGNFDNFRGYRVYRGGGGKVRERGEREREREVIMLSLLRNIGAFAGGMFIGVYSWLGRCELA